MLGILVLVVGGIAIYVLRFVAKKAMLALGVKKVLAQFVTSIGAAFFWLVLAAVFFWMIGLGQVSIALSGIAALFALGLTGVVGKIAGDIVAGVFLSIDKDFEVGQLVEIDGVVGKIEKLDLRRVRIRDKECRLHVFPNGEVDGKGWKVLTKNDDQRVEKVWDKIGCKLGKLVSREKK